ncbi:hypothetical protein RJD39_12745 [Vibrio scophthalmi]|uniref:hypothetical protein n=1 Tax=Vibrio scophthalmi TaxID=45658 RepID=UPI003872D178
MIMTKQQALIRVGRKIRELRGYDEQPRFIRKNQLDISQATLSRWESGIQTPPLHVLVNLGIIEIK